MNVLQLSLQRLRRRPGTTAFVAVVTGATLAAAGLLGTGLSALRGLETDGHPSTGLTAYLATDLTPGTVDAIKARVATAPGVARVGLVTAQQLHESVVKTLADAPELTEGLEPDWLPCTLEIDPEPGADAIALADMIRRMDGVDKVGGAVLGQGPVARLNALRRLAGSAGWTLLILLATAAATLIAGVAALHAAARREESELMRLFGATETAVRLPIVAEGTLLGALGSVLASGAVVAVVAAARSAIGGPSPGLAGLPVELPPTWTWIAFIMAGPILGGIGAALTSGTPTEPV